MPFMKKALRELMRREGLSLRSFAKKLTDFAEQENLGNFVKYAAVCHWGTGRNSPRMRELDALYIYAQVKGHDDLVFYEPPANSSRKV